MAPKEAGGSITSAIGVVALDMALPLALPLSPPRRQSKAARPNGVKLAKDRSLNKTTVADYVAQKIERLMPNVGRAKQQILLAAITRSFTPEQAADINQAIFKSRAAKQDPDLYTVGRYIDLLFDEYGCTGSELRDYRVELLRVNSDSPKNFDLVEECPRGKFSELRILIAGLMLTKEQSAVRDYSPTECHSPWDLASVDAFVESKQHFIPISIKSSTKYGHPKGHHMYNNTICGQQRLSRIKAKIQELTHQPKALRIDKKIKTTLDDVIAEKAATESTQSIKRYIISQFKELVAAQKRHRDKQHTTTVVKRPRNIPRNEFGRRKRA